jgi:hypothetical protein
MLTNGGVGVYETPAWRSGKVSMLTLDEFQQIVLQPGVAHVIGLQCPFGARAAKATSWVSFGCSFAGMPTSCPHPLRLWYSEIDNSTVNAKHPPSRGCVAYSSQPVPAESLRRTSPAFVSADLAHYPDLLNRFIAASMAAGVLRLQTAAVPGRSIPAKDFSSEQLVYRHRLKGPADIDVRAGEDRMAVGGLRDARASVAKLHKVSTFGGSLGTAIFKLMLRNHVECRAAKLSSWVDDAMRALGSDEVLPCEHAISEVRDLIAACTKAASTDEVATSTCDTPIRAGLLEAWRSISGDPDIYICQWLMQGAPAGISLQMESAGIFPEVDEQAEVHYDDLGFDFDEFRNYAGVEEDGLAEAEIVSYIDKGY